MLLLTAGIYLNTIYRLPNREYFAFMREMDEATFLATVGNIGFYGILQLVSLVLLNVMLVYKFRLPALDQLAFALQTQWQCVHAFFVLWIVYALQSPLEHVGALAATRCSNLMRCHLMLTADCFDAHLSKRRDGLHIQVRVAA
jgi:hypothetical protein